MEETVKFTVTEINQLLTALGKIPAEYSINLILFIKEKAESQLSVAQPELVDNECPVT